jgi:imidazolonepropionase-like amidohydrolase
MAVVALLLVGGLAAQRPTPAPAQVKSVLVRGGTVHIGDGRIIDDGAVGFREGRIDYVGFEYGVKAAYDTVIEVKGKHIYPGLILADATLGLQEIDQVKATADVDETGEMEPEVRAASAFNVDSRIIPTVRANGVLLVQATPRGGVISGASSVMQLDAWDPEAAVVKADEGIHLNWPGAYVRGGWWAEPGETSASKADERRKAIDAIRQFFLDARGYRSAGGVTDLRMAAMQGLFTGAVTLFVHADLAREIQEAVLFARELGVQRLVIVGGYDAWRVSDLLRDNKVDVVLQRLHALPEREDDDVDLPYRLPALLKERGVRFCLSYAGDHDRMGSRNLPFTAGTAAAYGLGKEEALQSVTLDAARILGIEARYGSLENGKSATLVVSDGDLLDMRGNNVVHAFIDGRRIILDDHQKALYRQYSGRFAR